MMGLFSGRGEFYVLGLTTPDPEMSLCRQIHQISRNDGLEDDQRVFLLEALWIIQGEKNSASHAVVTLRSLYRLFSLFSVFFLQHDLPAASFFLSGFGGNSEGHHGQRKEDFRDLPSQSWGQIYPAGKSWERRRPG